MGCLRGILIFNGSHAKRMAKKRGHFSTLSSHNARFSWLSFRFFSETLLHTWNSKCRKCRALLIASFYFSNTLYSLILTLPVSQRKLENTNTVHCQRIGSLILAWRLHLLLHLHARRPSLHGYQKDPLLLLIGRWCAYAMLVQGCRRQGAMLTPPPDFTDIELREQR